MNKKHLDHRINEQFYLENKVSNFSNFNIYYFNQIVSYCKKNKIKLYLLTTPLHKLYIKNVPEIFKKKYHTIINDNELDVINLQNLELNDSCYAYDGDHVTNKGANIITVELINSLKKF